MSNTLAAFTVPAGTYPPYINISERLNATDGKNVRITMRGGAIPNLGVVNLIAGHEVTLDLSLDDFRKFLTEALAGVLTMVAR